MAEQKKKAPVQVEQAEEIREVYFKTQYTDQGTGENLDAKKDIVKYASIGTKNLNEERVRSPIGRLEKGSCETF